MYNYMKVNKYTKGNKIKILTEFCQPIKFLSNQLYFEFNKNNFKEKFFHIKINKKFS